MNNILLLALSLTIGLISLVGQSNGLTFDDNGQIYDENTKQNVGPLENFTHTAQNGTQYTCQEGSAGKVVGCSPISNNTTQQIEQKEDPKELFDECVSVAGKSFCDVLFKNGGSQNMSNLLETQTNVENETRTFEDCYNDILRVKLLERLFSPDNIDTTFMGIMRIMNNLVTHTCEFYHEKLGIWINPIDADHIRGMEKYEQEYEQSTIEPICNDMVNMTKQENESADVLKVKQSCIAYMNGFYAGID